jgi:hypothetical protein
MVQPEIPTSQIPKKYQEVVFPATTMTAMVVPIEERSMCTDTGLIWTIVIQSHPKSRRRAWTIAARGGRQATYATRKH